MSCRHISTSLTISTHYPTVPKAWNDFPFIRQNAILGFTYLLKQISAKHTIYKTLICEKLHNSHLTVFIYTVLNYQQHKTVCTRKHCVILINVWKIPIL
ncbi:hypothetical protein XENTR_v10002938 [Xenopus tropicalis]|nr:hypothetical protein XENTR_v10002938 [Xenopus tropicalis]